MERRIATGGMASTSRGLEKVVRRLSARENRRAWDSQDSERDGQAQILRRSPPSILLGISWDSPDTPPPG